MRGEVGFESLYWIPFVHQLAHELHIPAERLIPISRGGACAWYGTPTGLELYAMRDPKDVRVENRQQLAKYQMLKQVSVSNFDWGVLRDAAETMKLGRKYLVLHPAWMYQALEPFWTERHGLGWLQARIRVEDLPVPPLPQGLQLPPQFVAVRFYFRTTYLMQQITVDFARETIKQIAAKVPVVLLNSGLHTDDHVDFEFKALPPNVMRLADHIPMLPATNLAIQSAVLARSLGFVGTYGGLAQLALRYKRPTVSFYTHWQGTALAHLALSRALGMAMGIPFNVLALNEIPMLQDVLPRMTVEAPQKVLDTPKDLSHAGIG